MIQLYSNHFHCPNAKNIIRLGGWKHPAQVKLNHSFGVKRSKTFESTTVANTLTLPENNILVMEVIRRSPVEVGSLSHYLHGLYIRGGAGFLSSRAAPENDGGKTRFGSFWAGYLPRRCVAVSFKCKTCFDVSPCSLENFAVYLHLYIKCHL